MKSVTMKSKSIKQKITRRIILIGLATFLLSTALAYLILVPFIKREAIDASNNVNAELVQQMDTLITYVSDYTENLSLSVAQNPDILRYFSDSTGQNQKISSLQLNNLIKGEGIVRCVIIDTDETLPIDSMSKITSPDYGMLDSEWYKELAKSDFARGLSSVYEVELNGTKYYTAAYLKNFYHNNQRFTYTVFFNLNSIIYNTNTIVGETLDYYALADSEGLIFFAAGNMRWHDIAQTKAKDHELNAVESVQNGILFKKSSINNKWGAVSFVSYSTIFSTFASLLVGVTFVLVIFLLLTLLLLSRSLGEIIKPISIMSRKMESVSQGNLDCQITVTSDDEIGKLGESFNKMISDLKLSIEIIAEKEKKDQQTKFSLLISQIDPHFIYNTINSINYLARKNRCDDVITVNTALICILRDRLRVNDIQITDSIANEIKVLDQYIVIHKFMYEGNLELVWQVDDELMMEQIPKNIIQPLVENSLLHGLIDEENGNIAGKIMISIKKDCDNLVVRVQDNGQGMDEETLHRVKNESYNPSERGKRIGLSNIRSRLYYLYGNSDCLQIESSPDKGTCITITLKSKEIE